jgi:hypothetical protein
MATPAIVVDAPPARRVLPPVDWAGARSAAATRSARSRTTSRAFLSSRSPWNDGWRSVPSRVHSVNDTSPTSVGLTHVARRPSAPVGGFTKGGRSARFLSSSRRISASDASLNPVPTLPAYLRSSPS